MLARLMNFVSLIPEAPPTSFRSFLLQFPFLLLLFFAFGSLLESRPPCNLSLWVAYMFVFVLIPSFPAKSKKQRRIAAKKQRVLEAKILASGDVEALAPKIPLQHQTINLPDGGDGSVSAVLETAARREQLKKAMRMERKAQIKEANYLKSM